MRSRSALGVIGAAVFLTAGLPAHAQSAPPLRDAASFVILGSSSVKNTGASRVTGNVGVSPGNVVTGFSPEMFRVGGVRRDDALARQARIDSNAAADALLSPEPCTVLDPVLEPDLGGRTLRPGIYCFNAADVKLNGTLILNAAEGRRDAVWIFRIDGTLTVALDAKVLVIGNGYDGNVFWSAGQATVGEHTRFIGNLFARSDIAFQEGASLSGRAISRTGSVTLDANEVSLCCAPLQLAPGTLPDGALGTPYRQVFSASGGTWPYTFTISSGSLPLGLELVCNGPLAGTLAGTPASLGTFEFTVTATDARNCSSSAAYSIDIGIDCEVRTPLRPAIVGVPYAEPLHFDGVPPFTCSITGGTLSSRWGVPGCVLSATPDAAGTFAFVVESTDALGVRRGRCLTIDVGECPIVFSPPDPPGGIACELYETYTFDAEGGTEPYRFTVPEGTLPPGWDLSEDTGKLTGTTAKAGTYIVPVTVTDDLGQACSRTFTISVSCPPPEGAAVTLPRGVVGVPYHQIIPSLACGSPATFSFVSGDEPPGLARVTEGGLVSGTPTKKGTYRFFVELRTTGRCTTKHEVTIDIDCPNIRLSALPPMVKNVPYDQTITVTGGIGPYQLTALILPAGLFPLEGNRIHGKPTTAGPYIFTVTAEDQTSGCTGSRTYNLTCPPLVVTPEVLPGGTVGDDYPDTTFMVTGGTAPYQFTVSCGSLPPGLDLDDGTLSGTPTVAGTFDFCIRITDRHGCSKRLLFCAIDVGAGSCPSGTTITLSPPRLPPAMPNVFYSQAITAIGGTAPYTFSVTSGTLPAGLTLNPLTGILSGIATETGTFSITITAIDANGCRGSVCYILRVGVAIPTISPWMLFVIAILLAGTGWIVVGRR